MMIVSSLSFGEGSPALSMDGKFLAPCTALSQTDYFLGLKAQSGLSIFRDFVRAWFLFHFPLFIFLFFSFSYPFIACLTLTSSDTSECEVFSPFSLSSPLLSYPSSLRSGPILAGVRARRRHLSTYSSSTRTSPLSFQLPTTCSTTWPLLPLSTSFWTYLCQLTISSDSPFSLSNILRPIHVILLPYFRLVTRIRRYSVIPIPGPSS